MTKEEQNIQAVKEAIEALNNGEIEKFLSYYTEDCKFQEVGFPEPLTKKEFKVLLDEWWNAYPDVKVDTQRINAEGDKVSVENVMSATFVNDLGGVKATGKFYQTREAVFFDMENGKIKYERVYLDQLHVDEQVGTL